MTDETKACPFCGKPGEAWVHEEIPTMHIAGCADGDCIGFAAAYDFVSRETAVAAWNTGEALLRQARRRLSLTG